MKLSKMTKENLDLNEIVHKTIYLINRGKEHNNVTVWVDVRGYKYKVDLCIEHVVTPPRDINPWILEGEDPHPENCTNTTISEERPQGMYQHTCPSCGWRGKLRNSPAAEGDQIE
jgi:hypothetical protein